MLFNPSNDVISQTGGYIYPAAGQAGFVQQSTGIPYQQGLLQLGNLPNFMRDYNWRDMMVTFIREGRANMTRALLAYARGNGAWVVNDVKPTIKVNHKPHPRFYLKAKVNQGGTKGSTYAKSTFILANPNDAKRLQPNDLINLNFAYVQADTDSDSVALDYVFSGGSWVPKRDILKPTQETCLVLTVDKVTGAVEVARNQGNDSRTASRAGIAVTVQANDTSSDPGANVVNAADAFFVRSGNTLSANSDDQLTYSRFPTFDYNTCQYVMRKWSSGELESNIQRNYPGFENDQQRNRRDMLEDLAEEMEFLYFYSNRYEDYDANGKWRGRLGGLFEFIPSNNWHSMEEPDYTDITKMGDFTIPRINKFFTDKFYYGAQEKIMVCGERWHTAFSTMINRMTQNIPVIVDRWDVRGYYFQCSNGGRLFVMPSDTLSLNGNNDIAVLLDPDTFQYGHLQNMDLNVVDPLPQTNIHEREGEIYGVITARRTNASSNHVIVLNPNQGG